MSTNGGPRRSSKRRPQQNGEDVLSDRLAGLLAFHSCSFVFIRGFKVFPIRVYPRSTAAKTPDCGERSEQIVEELIHLAVVERVILVLAVVLPILGLAIGLGWGARSQR